MRKSLLTALLATTVATAAYAEGQWEQIFQLPTAQAFMVTPNGNLLASTYLRDETGGIYVSTDRGDSWQLTEDVNDWDYSRFVQVGDDIYALGYQCYIARSTDQGETWEGFDYFPAVGELLPKGREGGACYGAAKLGNRVYFAEFNGGVFYTDDDCETFHLTDLESLSMSQFEMPGYDSIYNLESFNGKLYAFGLYVVWVYDEENDKWQPERLDSNCMSVSCQKDDLLITGRAMTNYGADVPLLMTLDMEGNWGELPNPSFSDDRYVRTICCDKNGNLYAGMLSDAFYYTPDMGESWYRLRDGYALCLPQFRDDYYMCPTSSGCDDEYLYCNAYWSDRNNMDAGIYRFPLAELPGNSTGIAANTAEPTVAFAVEGGAILSSDGQAVEVFDLQGRSLPNSQLPAGLYIARTGGHAQKIAVK